MDDPQIALKRAFDIDPNLAEVHITRASLLSETGHFEEADAEIATALRLDPDSYDVYTLASNAAFRNGNYADAIRYYEKAASLVDSDFGSLSMASQSYQMVGDMEGARSAARRALDRIEKEIAVDPANGGALGHGATLWAFLGQPESAKEWAARALLVDPTNHLMRYNLGCTMASIAEYDQAVSYLEGYFKAAQHDSLVWAEKDPDLDPLRTHPRFKMLLADAEDRLAKAGGAKEKN